ncbi:MAG TPA: hypothetical protein VHE35_01885 [Kofleriaceae bacterium]|nr:hypothetical protein [Kofleriaceae bacterium]
MKFLVGERRAVAASLLVFYCVVYLALSLSPQIPPDFRPIMTAHAALYGVAFFGLVAGWFWGRWYATGLGIYGLITGVVGMFQIGPEPVLVFIAVTHMIIPAFLAGENMAAGFDGRAEWRTRFHLDEPAVERLGKSVTRAAVSLPFLLTWALAPKNPGQGALLALAPFALGATGLFGLVRMRTWGIFALAGAGVAAAGVAAASPGPTAYAFVAAGLLAAAVAPFARPIARALAA